MLIDPKVTLKRYLSIEKGDLRLVKALVVHQTDAPTAQATFNGYTSGGNGAHFLIDKDGTIYQTASAKKMCYHVGRLIKSKCLELTPETCADPDLAKAKTLKWAAQVAAVNQIERKKPYPLRYPVNSDSLGIELVGVHTSKTSYEAPTIAQNTSLQWLVAVLYPLLSLTESNVYRHPQVSFKNVGEAAGAKWKP